MVATPGHPPAPRATRSLTYTKAKLFEEAAKARDYSCEALYLDPGWDTDMATLRWGAEWLGDRRAFVRDWRRPMASRLPCTARWRPGCRTTGAACRRGRAQPCAWIEAAR